MTIFWPLTPFTHAKKREKLARALADYHAQKAIEMTDHAAWATAQAQHHCAMQAVYEQRVSSSLHEKLKATQANKGSI